MESKVNDTFCSEDELLEEDDVNLLLARGSHRRHQPSLLPLHHLPKDRNRHSASRHRRSRHDSGSRFSVNNLSANNYGSLGRTKHNRLSELGWRLGRSFHTTLLTKFGFLEGSISLLSRGYTVVCHIYLMCWQHSDLYSIELTNKTVLVDCTWYLSRMLIKHAMMLEMLDYMIEFLVQNAFWPGTPWRTQYLWMWYQIIDLLRKVRLW